jgi:hypothetical protein
VDRLHEKHNVVRRLKDLVVSEIARPDVAPEARKSEAEATLFRGQIFGTRGSISRACRQKVSSAPSLSERRVGRNFSIRRIDNERRPVIELPVDEGRITGRVWILKLVGIGQCGQEDIVARPKVAAPIFENPLGALCQFGDFVIGQGLAALQFLGPFQRSGAFVQPISLQIRVTVACQGRGPGLGPLGRLRRSRNRQARQDRDSAQQSIQHRTAPLLGRPLAPNDTVPAARSPAAVTLDSLFHRFVAGCPT